MLIELLQTGLTAYTEQECTYLALVLRQPLATNKLNCMYDTHRIYPSAFEQHQDNQQTQLLQQSSPM